MTPEEPQAASVLKVKPAAAVEAAVAVEDALEAARAVEESEAEEAAALKHQKTSSPVHSSLAMSTPEHPSAPSAAQDVGSPRRLGEGLQLEEDLAAEDEWLSFQEMRLPTDSRDRQNKLQDMAESKANELLRWIRKNYADKAWVGGGSQPGAWREGGQWIGPSILTIESLTAGDMFRIIGNIPFHGAYKYGSLVVYNTNAKRTFAGVVNEDLYSHSCAKQMALQGLRDNSNATVSIAVTGNAMTKEKDWPKQGEVYCCCAAYSCADAAGGSKIFYRTSVFNVCKESRPPVPKALRELQSTCKDWTKGYATGREEKAGRVRGELEEALKRFCGSDCDTSKYQEIINKPREDGGLHELNESDRTRAMELVKSQEFLDLADSKVQIEKLVDVIAEKGDSPIHDRAGRMGHNAEVSQGIRTWTAAKAFEECLQLLMDIEAIPGRKYSIKAPLEVKEQLQLFGDHVPSAHAPPPPKYSNREEAFEVECLPGSHCDIDNKPTLDNTETEDEHELRREHQRRWERSDFVVQELEEPMSDPDLVRAAMEKARPAAEHSEAALKRKTGKGGGKKKRSRNKKQKRHKKNSSRRRTKRRR